MLFRGKRKCSVICWARVCMCVCRRQTWVLLVLLYSNSLHKASPKLWPFVLYCHGFFKIHTFVVLSGNVKNTFISKVQKNKWNCLFRCDKVKIGFICFFLSFLIYSYIFITLHKVNEFIILFLIWKRLLNRITAYTF